MAKKEIIPIDSTPIESKIGNWLKLKNIMEEAKNKLTDIEKTILEHVEPIYVQTCKELKKATNTCKVGELLITFKGASQFFTPSSLKEENLRKVFGRKYHKYFDEAKGYTITNEAYGNPKIKEKLEELNAWAKEELGITALEETTKIISKNILFEDWATNPDTYLLVEGAIHTNEVTRTKPTFNKE